VLDQPLLDFFLLSGQHNTLPTDFTGALAIFSHYVRAFVEDLDQSVSLGTLEVVGRWSRMVFLHTPL